MRTTIVDRNARAAEDLVARNFNPTAPDVTWAGDITYIPTGEGWLFLATVIDLFSRRVIGWGVADHLRTPLVADALEMAVATRGGRVEGVVFHSDRGCQYTSSEYRQLCERLGVTQSMGATGICFDNAPLKRSSPRSNESSCTAAGSPPEPRPASEIIRWIEGWYNARRLHSSIAYLTPNEKEAAWDTDRHRRITNLSVRPGQPQRHPRRDTPHTRCPNRAPSPVGSVSTERHRARSAVLARPYTRLALCSGEFGSRRSGAPAGAGARPSCGRRLRCRPRPGYRDSPDVSRVGVQRVAAPP